MFHQKRQTLSHTIALNVRRIKYGSPEQKVFCVGLQKTGTTSLQYALSKIGYRVAGIFSADQFDSADQMCLAALTLVPKFDAFADNPWCIFYQELDEAAPGAKFILTSRDPEKWYASVCKHFGNTSTRMREWVYGVGSPVGNKEVFIDKFIAHQTEVRRYFSHRPDDFLELDVSRNDAWAKVCHFLGKKRPSAPFPHLNTAKMRR